MRFIVNITFRDEEIEVEIPDNRGIADIVKGFWVNAELKWCVYSEIKYYIPASQIILIRKASD